MMQQHNFLIVREYRCPLCGAKLDFFHRKYDDSSVGGRHPKNKCARSGETYYVPSIDLTVMKKEFR